MSAAIDCPNCGSTEVVPRDLPGNHDRGPIRVFICSHCGEQIGPVFAESDPTSSPIVRPAAKPSNVVSLVSRRAAKLGRKVVCVVSSNAPLEMLS